MYLLLVPFLIWRDPSTLRAETSNTKPTSFYFGQFMKPAHVINYIIPAMAPTRGRPLFNCFRAQVHACTRCLQSKVAPFQQPFMEANVKGGHGPLTGSDGPGCDADGPGCDGLILPGTYQAHQTRSQCLAPHIYTATVMTVAH